MTSVPPSVQPSVKKKTSPWVWVGLGCGGIIVIGLILAGLVTFWGIRKGKNFLDEAEKNPVFAGAKFMVKANPELDVVSEDASAGTLTIRNNKTGETITMNAKDIQEGRLSFKTDKGEEVTFEGKSEGDSGTFKVKTKDGEMAYGAGTEIKVPDWVPTYPGAQTEGTYSASNDEGNSGGYTLKSTDGPGKVLEFFEDRLKNGGFDVSTNKFEQNGAVSGGMVAATADDGARSVNVTVSADDGGTGALVAYQAKKN